tara:strand:+ start:135 stop:572 length:438 start_codon:yes stop_codon:yes gene_type:complete
MTLVKWTPKPLSMFDEMDNIINTMFGSDWNFPSNHKGWSPAVDVKETNELFSITANIPGLTKKDVKVNISKKQISISGKMIIETDNENSQFHYRERPSGAFNRSFNIPESVNVEDISASFSNGILEIKLPKHENILSKEREIKIN